MFTASLTTPMLTRVRVGARDQHTGDFFFVVLCGFSDGRRQGITVTGTRTEFSTGGVCR